MNLLKWQSRSFLLLLLLAAASGRPSHSQSKPPLPDPLRTSVIDQMFKQEFTKDKAGALTVGLIKEGRLVWTKSYGFIDQRHNIPATETTVYGIGSVTKIFTGLMLLQLVDRGKVHLSDPVERYFPEVNLVPKKYPWSPPITLIQLATMSAGLQATTSTVGDSYAIGPASDWQKQLLAALPHTAYVYEPGTRRLYSNISYSILGAALERAAGRSYLDYIQEEILKPLGMTGTSFLVTPDLAPRVAKGYYLGKEEIDPNFPQQQNGHQGYWTPVGGLLSTVPDLAKLMRFQLGYGPNSVLKLEALESAFTGLVASDADLLYGDGVGFSAVRNEDGHIVVLGHGGLRRGYVASYEFDESTKTGIIALSSSSGGNAEYKPLVRRILSMLNPNSRGGTGEPLQESH
ncbi:MAG TPA: serine hydrolase domain-containing protein [Terriglobales bacterium]|nr:serine hydrolase domain-containing protein [Terriglobales bacterium]